MVTATLTVEAAIVRNQDVSDFASIAAGHLSVRNGHSAKLFGHDVDGDFWLAAVFWWAV